MTNLNPNRDLLRPSIDTWRTLKAIEWTLLAVMAISIAIRPSFYNSTVVIAIAISTISLLFLLSFKPPIDRSLSWRRTYILLELGIAEIGDGIHSSFDMLTYFILLKACLFLPQRTVVWMAILAGIVMLYGTIDRSPTNFAMLREYGVEPFLNLPMLCIRNTIAYFAICVFVLLTGFLWRKEQQSRARAEQLTQQVETLAADLERSRIARDIHDVLGHSLTTLDIQLELAQSIYYQDPLRAAISIDIAKQLSSKCLQDVRYALQSMHRSNFDLDSALLTLIEQFQHSKNVRIHYHFDFPQLPLQVGHQLYCVAQESLTNIQKHAKADRIDMSGFTINEGVCLIIKDDGRGFVGLASAVPNRHEVRSGFGIQNMRDRVLSLGGQFEIDSQPDVGTQIQVFIPL
jgi:signal transduction histidine kinase